MSHMNHLTFIRDLRQVRKLLEQPHNWTKGTAARDENDVETDWCGAAANSWCLTGAFLRVCGFDGMQEHGDLFEHIMHERGLGRFMDEWNDAPERTHAEVLALIDSVIREFAPTYDNLQVEFPAYECV